MSELLDTWFSLWIGRFITVWTIGIGLFMVIGFVLPKLYSLFVLIFADHPLRFLAFLFITVSAAIAATVTGD